MIQLERLYEMTDVDDVSNVAISGFDFSSILYSSSSLRPLKLRAASIRIFHSA